MIASRIFGQASRGACALLALIALSPTVMAASVTLQFNGTLETSLPEIAPLGAPEPIMLSVSYDDAAAGSAPVSPDEFRFSAIASGEFSTSGNKVTYSGASVVLVNDSDLGFAANAFAIPGSPASPPGTDILVLSGIFDESIALGGKMLDGFEILLIDSEGSALVESTLPSALPDFDLFEFAAIRIAAFDGAVGGLGFDGFSGGLSAPGATTVPSPPALILLASSLSMLVRQLRKRSDRTMTGYSRA